MNWIQAKDTANMRRLLSSEIDGQWLSEVSMPFLGVPGNLAPPFKHHSSLLCCPRTISKSPLEIKARTGAALLQLNTAGGQYS